MKYFKLNRRFNNYKIYGHQHGFKFNLAVGDINKARAVEEILRSKYGYHSRSWSTFFGKRPRMAVMRFYYITFKGEDSLISYIMLKVL